MHFENLLFILLIAMAALLRLLATKAGKAKKSPPKSDQRSTVTPQVSQPIRRASVESDQERIRRFLEALGQPTTAKPPPPIVPRTLLDRAARRPVQFEGFDERSSGVRMAKRALITGITGQDGSYLAELLLEKGYEVFGMMRRSSAPNLWRVQHILDRIVLKPERYRLAYGIKLSMVGSFPSTCT